MGDGVAWMTGIESVELSRGRPAGSLPLLSRICEVPVMPTGMSVAWVSVRTGAPLSMRTRA